MPENQLRSLKPIHWALAAVVFLALAFVGVRFALEAGEDPGEGPPIALDPAESTGVEDAPGAEHLGVTEPESASESATLDGPKLDNPELDDPAPSDRAEVRTGTITGSVEDVGLWTLGSIRAFALRATPDGRAARELAPRVFERAPEDTAELESLAVARAVCDSEGRFSLTGLELGREYRVLLRSTGGVFIAESPAASVEVGAHLEFQGHLSGPVRFEVSVPGERSVARATLMHELTGLGEVSWDWQPDDPPVWLGLGFLKVSARVEADWVEPRPPWAALQLNEGPLVLAPSPPSPTEEAQPGRVRIALGFDPGLEVEVLDPFDQLQRMPCNVRVVPAEDALRLEEPLSRVHGSWRFDAADRRWYDLRATGEYIVRLVDDLGRTMDEARVEVLEGYSRTTLTVAQLEPFESLSVDLRSPEGAPLEGAELGRLQDSEGLARRWSGEFRWTDERYVAPLASPQEAPWPKGRGLELKVEHPELGAHWLPVGPDDRELSFRFERPAELTVGLLDEELQSPRVDVDLKPLDEQLGLLGRVYFGGLGNRRDSHTEVRFAPLAPGRYLVIARKQRRGGDAVLAQAEVELAPGAVQSIELGASAGSDLEVHVPHLSPGASLRLEFLEGAGGFQWQEVPEDRHVTFTELQPGEYELSAAVPSEALTITVPSSPIVAELHMPNGFRIPALDDEDPLRAAGLLPGDLILAVGGFELDLLVGGAPVDPELIKDLEQATTVTVRRDGQRLDVDLGENLMTLSFRAQATLDGPREGYPWEQVYLAPE